MRQARGTPVVMLFDAATWTDAPVPEGVYLGKRGRPRKKKRKANPRQERATADLDDPVRLFAKWAKLVERVTTKFGRFLGRDDRDDLRQELRTKLWLLSGSYDPAHGVKQITYFMGGLERHAKRYTQVAVRKGLTHVGDTARGETYGRFTTVKTIPAGLGATPGRDEQRSVLADLPSSVGSPAAIAAAAELRAIRRKAIKRAMRKLTRPERHAVKLAYQLSRRREPLDVGRIALEMRCPEAWAKEALRDGRKKLCKGLGGVIA